MINYLFSKSKSKCFKRLGLLALLFMFTAGMYAQTTVTGTVSDADGPLPGVNVVLKGTNIGTNADFDGNYSISVPADGVLIFSAIGFSPQEIAVDGRTEIDVLLESSTNTLDEVIVIGYGTMERANVTGAISTVDVAEIAKVPVPNVIEALRGQVAGLRVTRGNGQPGSSVNFTIRGYNSLGGDSGDVEANNQPIIVIDGVPMTGGNISEINPDDIASLNVLKDAAAAAIYGSSGANGAILITTKSGKGGKAQITVNASSGISQVTSNVNIMNGDQYLKYRLDSEIAGGNTNPSPNSVLNAEEIANYIAGTPVDWQDELLRQGTTNNVSLSINGGTEDMHFYLNADMYTETGIVVASDYKRYSVRFNADYKPTKWLKVGARTQFTKSFADETSNVISEFNQNGGFAPFVPIFDNTPWGSLYNEDGSYTKILGGDQFQINPFHRYQESNVDRKVTRSYINPYLEFNIIEGLTYTLNSFAEDRQQFYGRFQSSDYADGDPSEGQIQKQNTITYLVDNIINYTKDFGKHSINATFVYGFQNFEYEQMDAFADKLPTDLLGYHAINDALSEDQRYNWTTDEWGKVYYVGRVGYTFDDRYVATVTIRRDGSSKFTGKYKYGNFPSASFAWNAHNEAFWGDKGIWNTLKVRLSYGELGNDRIATYSYLANSRNSQTAILVENPNYDPDDPASEEFLLQNVTGYAKDTPPNEDLRWETSKQFNVGIDFGFFNNRLNGSMDYYKTKTTDLLLTEFLPITSGYQSITSNIGETENWGIDVALRGAIVETEDFIWDATINWAMDRNSIVRLNRASVDADGNPIDDPANGWFIGKDIREIFSYKYTGVWQTEEAAEAAGYGKEPGDAKFEDINEDGTINADDRQFLGNPTPDWYGGLTNTFSYRGIELSILFEAVQGVTKVNNFYGAYTGRNNAIAIDYWTPDNPTNAFPQPGTGEMSGTFGDAIKTQDASFVALRNVSLTYKFNKKQLDNTPLKALSFYVRGNNLHYFTDFEDAYSPEAGRGAYPITKIWTFGTTVTF